MTDKKSVGHAYNTDFLNVVFAAVGIFLFFASVWMVWDDYAREWKSYQRRFVQLETEVTQANLQQALSEIDEAKLEELREERAEGAQQIEVNQTQIDELEAELEDLETKLFLANQEYQFTKAEYDAKRYEFEEMQESDPKEATKRLPEIEAMFQHWLELGLEVERLTGDRDDLRSRIGTFTSQVAELDIEIRDLTAEATRLETRLVDLAPSIIGDYVLNAPLLDFMAPTITVQQVITPNLVDDVNFIRVTKMDRCTSCHLSIDREGYEEYPQPFRTHSNLEAYVSSGSPHPLGRFGCTVCHEGMGQSISFKYSSHTPAGEEQTHAWEDAYGWEEPHLWDYPMLPTEMTEASCAKCHKETVFVPAGPKLSLAYYLYERAGCYACHKTVGFENLRNPGPALRKIGAKLTPEWVSRWIRDPRAIKTSTWMPKFWYNSNTSSAEDARRNEAEIDAVVAYLFANSDDHQFAIPSPPKGNAIRGEELVKSVGCLGCHIAEGENRLEAGPRRTFGQPLQSIANKTTYEWLFNWVLDPQHFSTDTYMPSLRLTEQEVADVATYLFALEGPEGEGSAATADAGYVAEVLTDYLKSIVPTAEAEARVTALSPEEQQLDLGRRAIGRYGCFSCHEIAGFEDTAPIGIELSQEGSKLLPRLDFAFVHEIPHTKVGWFREKMDDPRIFDRHRVLQPLEKLRMPNYGMSAEEITLFTTALMSFQSDVQPVAMQESGSARNDALRNGRNLLRRRNCVACHEIEGSGGDYRELVEDPSLAPPLLTPEGAKVKPEWLYAFLRAPITIRPWLNVRMPTFDLDDTHWNTVIDYFAAVSESGGPFRTHDIVPTVTMTRTGRELFELLRCQQCHVLDTIPEDQPTDNLAPDLRMAGERLQPEWIIDWLREPLVIQPGTRMPLFWTEYPSSFYPQFEADAVQQIESVRDYLLTFRGGPSPLPSN